MSPSRQVATDVATILIAICSLVVTGLVVKREIFTHRAAVSLPPEPPSPVADWSRLSLEGRRFGSPNAPVTIVEFSDFECPFCRTFTMGTLSAIRREFPEQVTVLYRHWPLTSIHRFAYPAARAAECAGRQDRFEAFHDLVFAKQDSLGLKTFTEFARESGVPDLVAFRSCNAAVEPVPAIEADIVAAERLGGGGTPTVVINGLRLPAPPDSAALATMIRTLLSRHARG